MAETAAQKKARETAEGAEGTAGNPVDVSTIPAIIPLHTAWARVMRDVTVIAKGDRTKATGNYMYRGVDRVVNEVGPVLREHGVIVMPHVLSLQHRDVKTSGGKPAHEVIVEVGYTITGPDGSTMEGSAYGESTDSNDKATPQAMSVAYRTFLLQGLCIPSGDRDPDENDLGRGSHDQPSQAHTERSEAPSSPPGYTDEQRAAAVAAGWPNVEQRDETWRILTRRMTTISEENRAEIIAWGKDEHLDASTFTRAQAEVWHSMVVAGETANREAEDGAVDKAREAFGATITSEGAGYAADDPERPFEPEPYDDSEEPF